MHLRSFIIAAVVTVACVSARSAPNAQNAIPDERRSQDLGLQMTDLRFVYRTYQECASTDMSACLKLKLITALDRAARNVADISLYDGVTFVKNPTAEVAASVPATENELKATLPRTMEDRDNMLNELILEKVFNFFKSHTLQVL